MRQRPNQLSGGMRQRVGRLAGLYRTSQSVANDKIDADATLPDYATFLDDQFIK